MKGRTGSEKNSTGPNFFLKERLAQLRSKPIGMSFLGQSKPKFEASIWKPPQYVPRVPYGLAPICTRRKLNSRTFLTWIAKIGELIGSFILYLSIVTGSLLLAIVAVILIPVWLSITERVSYQLKITLLSTKTSFIWFIKLYHINYII